MEEELEEVDINIHNVVAHFSTCCHLNLRQIAISGSNVIYKRDQAMVLMKLRNPNCTANIWSSGKIIVTGPTSEDDARKASRRVARVLQKLGFVKVRFRQFRIVNVLGIVKFPFGIRIAQFTEEHRNVCSYEPELHPGATYRWNVPKHLQPDYTEGLDDNDDAEQLNGDSAGTEKKCRATFKIFQTGAVTITAPNVAVIDAAVHHIYPLVDMFKKPKQQQPPPPQQQQKPDTDHVDVGQNGAGKKRKRATKNSDSNNNGKKKLKRRNRQPVDPLQLSDEDLNFIHDGSLSPAEGARFTSESEMASDDSTSSDSD